VEELDPGGHTYPGAHGPLHAGLVSPTLSPYTPAGQLRQTADPVNPYRPTGHSCAVEEVDPAGQAYPAVQLPLHDEATCPPVAPYEPGRQGAVHTAVVRPGSEPYSPVGQSLQVPAAAREYLPAGHSSMLALAVPAGQAKPGLHTPLQPAVVL
jgi:hypothetical protein